MGSQKQNSPKSLEICKKMSGSDVFLLKFGSRRKGDKHLQFNLIFKLIRHPNKFVARQVRLALLPLHFTEEEIKSGTK